MHRRPIGIQTHIGFPLLPLLKFILPSNSLSSNVRWGHFFASSLVIVSPLVGWVRGIPRLQTTTEKHALIPTLSPLVFPLEGWPVSVWRTRLHHPPPNFSYLPNSGTPDATFLNPSPPHPPHANERDMWGRVKTLLRFVPQWVIFQYPFPPFRPFPCIQGNPSTALLVGSWLGFLCGRSGNMERQTPVA